MEGPEPEVVSEAALLAMARPALPDPAVRVAQLEGQVGMMHMFLDNRALNEKVARQEIEITDLKAQLRAQEPLLRQRVEKEVQDQYRITAEEVDRVKADAMREMDQETQRKRPRLERSDIDDLQRVLRHCAERMRLLLRQQVKQ